MNKITLSLTIDEINLALTGLGSLPYAQVVALVNNISNQAMPQVNSKTIAPEVDNGQPAAI